MTEARYRELLTAAPPMSRADLAGMTQVRVKIRTMTLAVLWALAELRR